MFSLARGHEAGRASHPELLLCDIRAPDDHVLCELSVKDKLLLSLHW